MIIENLFFQLIQASTGTRECLSYTPSADEWVKLFNMAKKQSLIGICFFGVQRLQAQAPPEMLYLTWMGMAAKIQQRNEELRKIGEELISELQGYGMKVCILKGQSLSLYYNDLINLRQSGDIDIWVKNKSLLELDAHVKGLGMPPHTTAAHVSYEFKDGVEIELHAVPMFFRSFWNNRKFIQWAKSFNGSQEEFYLAYMMVHMYHHVLFEGLGLRQVMDYYFVIKASLNLPLRNESIHNAINTIKDLGMFKFASGIFWVIEYVFREPLHLFINITPNEKVGKLLLGEILCGGNFGHHDEKNKNLHGGTAVGRSLNGLKRNMKFFALGPAEILCSPLWSLWHWVWRKRRGLL